MSRDAFFQPATEVTVILNRVNWLRDNFVATDTEKAALIGQIADYMGERASGFFLGREAKLNAALLLVEMLVDETKIDAATLSNQIRILMDGRLKELTDKGEPFLSAAQREVFSRVKGAHERDRDAFAHAISMTAFG